MIKERRDAEGSKQKESFSLTCTNFHDAISQRRCVQVRVAEESSFDIQFDNALLHFPLAAYFMNFASSHLFHSETKIDSLLKRARVFPSCVYQCIDICSAASTFIIPVYSPKMPRKSIHGVFKLHAERCTQSLVTCYVVSIVHGENGAILPNTLL